MNQQSGFTLIEMLLVLSIFLVMALVSTLLIRPQYFMMEKERFYVQLKGDLLYAQQYAISHQKRVVVSIRPNENRYFIVPESNSTRIVERKISPAVTIGNGTLKNLVEFSHNGNVTQFGTIVYSVGKQQYEIYIQIGAGRIRLEKK